MKSRQFASFAFIVLMLAAGSLPLSAFVPRVKAVVLYDSGNPTAEEQLVLEYINRARSNPVAEGQRLGIDIHEGLSDPSLVGPRPPLAMNRILLGIAQAHTQDMYRLDYFSHNDPNGATPFGRMINAGYNYVLAGENMAGGTDQTAAELEDFMMVDSGTPGRPHRVNLLDINPYPCGNPPCVYSEIGIGYYEGATPNSYGNAFITEDFGAKVNSGPFLLGVVYNDANGNNFYDIGEDIAGVTITPSSGAYYAVSSSSGGYVIPIGTSGTITVTASGPGFGPITKTVTLTGANVKLDFRSQDSSVTTQSTASSQTSNSYSTTSQTSNTFVNAPSITLSPTSGFAGSTITVIGSRFSTSDTTCSFSGGIIAGQICTIFRGGLSGGFTVANVGGGTYTITAIGRPAGDSASATFTVTGSGATIALSPSSGQPGMTVTVTGYGFRGGDTTCALTGAAVASYPSATCFVSNGALTGSFVVANVPGGSYTVTATDQTAGDSASASFQVIASSASITLNPSSAHVAATVEVHGAGFSTTDTSCSLSTSSSVASPTCSISYGTLTGSFIVANVPPGSYVIATTGSSSGDSASASLTVLAPTIALNLTSGPPGSTITVSGSGFYTSDTTCSLAGQAVATESCSISGGSLSGSFSVASTAAGSYSITAITNGADSGLAAASLQLCRNPSIATNPVSGKAGASVQVSGSGFSLGDGACSLSGDPVSSPTCSISSGTLTATFNVADVAPGVYTINASGSPGSDSASTTFTVTIPPSQTTISASLATTTTISATTTTATRSATSTTTTSSAVSSSITAIPVPQCLIATATYSSALAPEVQILRNFRDNSIMKTMVGSSFMIAFNTWYYSFSPYVASYLQAHPIERTMMKAALYPLIGILWLASATFNMFKSYPEVAALISGLLASALIGATYLALPVAILESKVRRLRDSRRQRAILLSLAITLLMGLAGLGLGELLPIVPLLISSTVTIVLSVMLLTATQTANTLTNMLQRKNQH
jgi:uncharacterized membrane protein YhaH (DUF805 family)